LTHLDTTRDGIWIFEGSVSPSTSSSSHRTEHGVLKVLGVQLVVAEKGVFEPASLARTRQATNSALNSASSNSSPSSSLETPGRAVSSINSRAVQANSALNLSQESAIPFQGQRPVDRQEVTWSTTADIHDRFIAAVLGSLVSTLCRDEGFIPLNPRTLILNQSRVPSSGGDNDGDLNVTSTITLATLDISLTSLGTLVIKVFSDGGLDLQSIQATSGPTGKLGRLTPGTMLWLAPGGNTAHFYAFPDQKGLPNIPTGNSSVTTPSDSKLAEYNELTVKSWKSSCLDWLSTKGVDIAPLDDGGWVFVRMHNSSGSLPCYEYVSMCGGSSVLPWPALLCFSSSNTPGLRSWSTKKDARQAVDPLSFAEEWFLGEVERSNALRKRENERQMTEAISREQAEVDARALQSSSYSPVVLRRGSNAGAMYPTPPDAIHHPTIGATPVFDGAGSTPNNTNPFATQDGGPVAATSRVSDADMDMWGTTTKKERNNDNESDLFGDLGDDMFGNDVTDADFSFFDEPDDMEPDPKAESPAAVDSIAVTEDFNRKPAPTNATPNVEGMYPPPTAIKQTEDSDKRDTTGAMKPPRIPNNQSIISNPPPAEETVRRVEKTSLAPFNQETIFRHLVKEPNPHSHNHRSRRESLFEKINFENSLNSVDDKYGAQGAYNVSEPKRSTPVLLTGLPQTSFLSMRKKSLTSDIDMFKFPQLLLEDRITETAGSEDAMDLVIDSDGVSTSSEQDDISHSTGDSPAVTTTGFEKNWLDDDGQSDPIANFDPMAIDFEQSASTPQSAVGTLLPFPEMDSTNWNLTTYFTTPEPEMSSGGLNDLERIATAQILVDQVVGATLQIPWSPKIMAAVNKTTGKGGLVRTVAKASRMFFKDITTCTLRSFSEIQGIPVLNQGLRLPPRPLYPKTGTTLDTFRTNNPFQIPLPYLELRRSDSKLSVLPSAVVFWENLGLAPSGGTKDILSACVYPDVDGAQSAVTYFIEHVRNTYESYRLGVHETIVSRDIFSGHLPYPLETDPQHLSRNLVTLRETVARIASAITAILSEEKNFVIYFLYPTDDPTLLVHICSAFQHLFNLYRKALTDRKISPSNELVLQLVPIDFIASPTSIPVPLPVEYGRLCLEVYSRCMDFASLNISPAIMLERPLPRGIDFKLNSAPSAAVLQENTCLHVAYAQSVDSRWMTAVWTDNRGTKQMNASYCLGRKNEPLSMSFTQVATEIWNTTIDFISSKKIHWRILIVKIGIMEASEVDIWTDLTSRESHSQINLTLLTVHTDPSLRLLPPAPTLPGARDATQTTTPVSTPQTSNSILSPEISTPTQPTTTLSEQLSTIDPDPSTRLLLLSDQTHGLVLAHRLSNSRSLFNPNPALMSGYLIKHSTPTPVLIEVNVIHSEVVGNPRTYYEALLREVLSNFAGLATLSRSRGTTGAEDARPWHIAAAEKGVQVLHALM
jgi:mediator of RNA polymerase II transcription subunit 13